MGCSYYLIMPTPLVLLVHLLDSIKHAITVPLFYLGLCQNPDRDQYYSIPPVDPPFSTCASYTAPTSAMIKRRLPVVEFRLQLAKSVEAPAACAVCLGGLDAQDLVRELGSCCHAFHKDCIDRWVDMGQVTCPLCRAELLPTPHEEETKAEPSPAGEVIDLDNNESFLVNSL